MIQFNTEAVVPFFVSTEGYGLLWDNYAETHLNPVTHPLHLTADPAPPVAGSTAAVYTWQARLATGPAGVYHIMVKGGDGYLNPHQYLYLYLPGVSVLGLSSASLVGSAIPGYPVVCMDWNCLHRTVRLPS